MLLVDKYTGFFECLGAMLLPLPPDDVDVNQPKLGKIPQLKFFKNCLNKVASIYQKYTQILFFLNILYVYKNIFKKIEFLCFLYKLANVLSKFASSFI